jgi:hypothetical protein
MRTPFILCMTLLAALFSLPVAAQEPTPVPTPPPTTESSSAAKAAPGASRHSDDFLVRGTVFTEKGLALSGAELRIRRTSDKKPRWQTTANSRGDFAVRVKMGAEYEVTVRAKGFADQLLPVDAKGSERVKDLVVRMQPAHGGKKS